MAAAVGQRELLALVSAAGAMYVLAGLQVNHLVAVLVVSLWAAVGLFWSGWLTLIVKKLNVQSNM